MMAKFCLSADKDNAQGAIKNKRRNRKKVGMLNDPFTSNSRLGALSRTSIFRFTQDFEYLASKGHAKLSGANLFILFSVS